MQDLFNVDFIVSSATGGGFVWAAIKIHLSYITSKLNENDKRLERLENYHFNRRVQDHE